MAGDRCLVQLEPIEQPNEVALVIGVAVRVGVPAEAVSSKVERNHANACEQRDDAQPVAEMTGQPVQEDDRRACSRIGVGESFRAPILVPTAIASSAGTSTMAIGI
jgi:hypothetical protein